MTAVLTTWDTPNKLFKTPTFDCHAFTIKLKDYSKEWTDQLRWSHAAIPYRDGNPYLDRAKLGCKVTLQFSLFAPLPEYQTSTRVLCHSDLPLSNTHDHFLITLIVYLKHACQHR